MKPQSPIDHEARRPAEDARASRWISPGKNDIDFARGIACFLIVLFHIFGGRQANGLHIPDDSVIRDILNIFSFIRMPLFAFISGYVYVFKPAEPGRAGPFILKKLRRVGLPFLFVSTLFYISQNALGQRDVIMQPWQIYFFKYEIFWFIQAIILLFVLLAIADASRLFTRPSALLCAIMLPLVVAPYLRDVDLFSLGGATFLAPFFFAGVATHRFAKFTRQEMVALAALLVVALIVHTENVLALPDGEQPIRETLLALVIGVSASILLVYNAPRSAIISRIGRSSLPIFLYHIFFIAAARELLQAAGVDILGLQVAAGLAAGVIGPLVVENVIARVPYLRMALLGLSPRAEKPRAVESLRA